MKRKLPQTHTKLEIYWKNKKKNEKVQGILHTFPI